MITEKDISRKIEEGAKDEETERPEMENEKQKEFYDVGEKIRRLERATTELKKLQADLSLWWEHEMEEKDLPLEPARANARVSGIAVEARNILDYCNAIEKELEVRQ